MRDPYATLRESVVATVVNGEGHSDSDVRRAAFDGDGVPEQLQTLVTKVHRHAYKVTDEEVAAAQAAYGDDQMFEIIVSAALGASHKRLVAGLRALEEA